MRLEEMLEPEDAESMLARLRMLEPVTYTIPPLLIERLQAYVKDRVPTGDFLRAVLENNLKEAVGRADVQSQRALCAIVSYCYNHIPSACWGSPEKVEEWLKKS